MKIICEPSQVMREGRDLNQQGQAGRQEQASSSSPVTFHEVLLAAMHLPGLPITVMPHAIAIETTDFLNSILFISVILSVRVLSECNPALLWVNFENHSPFARVQSLLSRSQGFGPRGLPGKPQ